MSIYYLWPTAANMLEQNYIAGLPEAERATYVEENAQRLQNLRLESLSLGLDLQGGMNVTLEVQTPQLILELAGDFADAELEEIVNAAEKQSFENNTDFIEVLVAIFEERNPDGRLSRYYRSDSQNITRRSSNEEIETYLKQQRDNAVDRAMEIIRTRVDRFGVTEPAIYVQVNRRVVVELPGVADKQRIRDLLRGTARLEFRLAAEPNQINSARQQIMNSYNQLASSDTSASSHTLQQQDSGQNQNPLAQVLSTQTRSGYAFGYAVDTDTARVNELLQDPEVQELMPRNMVLMWGASPFQTTPEGREFFEMIGVRSQVEMTGEVIVE